jgi:hypothetical protein
LAVLKKVGQARVELDFSPGFAQHLVAQFRHLARQHVGQQVVQVGDLPGEMIAPPLVVLHQVVRLAPERRFVDPVAPKQGRLHVFRD